MLFVQMSLRYIAIERYLINGMESERVVAMITKRYRNLGGGKDHYFMKLIWKHCPIIDILNLINWRSR